MNKKGFAVAAALLVGAGLTPALPGVGSQAARAEDLNKVDFETSATGKARLGSPGTSVAIEDRPLNPCGSSFVD